jgi:hypothetical protein
MKDETTQNPSFLGGDKAIERRYGLLGIFPMSFSP